jgi:hypothetical protein
MALKTLRTTLLGIATVALVAGQLVYTDTTEARGFGGARGYARTSVNVNRGFDRNVQTSRNPIFPHAQAPEFLSEPTFVGHSR